MVNYKLLTPGPLTTTSSVKEVMMTDHDTWDDDYKSITQSIRKELLEIAGLDPEVYTTVLIQGSGTYNVESVIDSSMGPNDKLLILANGAYGERIGQIAERHQLNHVLFSTAENVSATASDVETVLAENPDITHLAMVHSETTSGILNPLDEIAQLAKARNLTLIIDAMSSFGGVIQDWQSLDADYIISSSNKCIQGVPGFGFIFAKKDSLMATKGQAQTLSLDLYDQWLTMEKDNGKWRFTSPTHTVLAFEQAIKELAAEGGVAARASRYAENNRVLRKRMIELGFTPFVSDELQGPIITSFLYPEGGSFEFMNFYEFVKERGYAMYPGKVSKVDSFRIGNIGEIYPEDMEKVTSIIAEYMEGLND